MRSCTINASSAGDRCGSKKIPGTRKRMAGGGKNARRRLHHRHKRSHAIQIDKIKEFNNKRSIHARNHLRTQFNLSTPKNIIVGVLPKNAGKIKINSI